MTENTNTDMFTSQKNGSGKIFSLYFILFKYYNYYVQKHPERKMHDWRWVARSRSSAEHGKKVDFIQKEKKIQFLSNKAEMEIHRGRHGTARALPCPAIIYRVAVKKANKYQNALINLTSSGLGALHGPRAGATRSSLPTRSQLLKKPFWQKKKQKLPKHSRQIEHKYWSVSAQKKNVLGLLLFLM